MTNPRRVQCGAPDCKRQFTNDRMREYQRRYKEKHGFYQSRLYGKGRKKQYAITCAQCGREAVVTKTTSRYCSHRCFYDARYGVERPRDVYAGLTRDEYGARERAKTRRRRAERKLAAAASGVCGAGLWCAGRCAECGDRFVRRSSSNPTAYCSSRCRQLAAAALRRALERGVEGRKVSRLAIYERDDWTCHICGDQVDRDAQVPDLAAPVLDHVIPIARGGSHTEDNLKTAHFYCNSVKRDLADGWSAVA
jgi:5-methylcytosine-specific restriction endonuclease McrA